ncbi:MAG TPA: TadE/TadG family type IV pilus assembly protein [Candidatus Cybelea sp.]|nr:TadE/TadG family type IV pilus assembly protein [Candidatus Cybelea sp.]
MIARALRSESGTSLIEFALLAPALIMLLVGLIEVGRFAYFGILAAHAAEAGAHYGAQNLETAVQTTSIQNAALADAQNLSQWRVTATTTCTESGVTVSCTASASSATIVYFVQVHVTGAFTSLLKYPGIPNQIPVSSTATARVLSQ